LKGKIKIKKGDIITIIIIRNILILIKKKKKKLKEFKELNIYYTKLVVLLRKP